MTWERRVFGASVELEMADLAVNDVDIELWDATRSTLLGQCCMSVAPLLLPGGAHDDLPPEPALTNELTVVGPGGAAVETLKATRVTSG